MTVDQQELVDDLWAQFLSTGRNANERGYMLDQIPEKLHASWGQSCLKGSTVNRALRDGTASPAPILALPVSPEHDRSYDRDRSISVASSSYNRAHPHGSAASSSGMSAATAMPFDVEA